MLIFDKTFFLAKMYFISDYFKLPSMVNCKIYMRLNIKPCEKIFHVAGLTKPGEVGNFFILVLMKSPYSCHKANFQSPCQSLEVCIFSPIIIVFLQYSHIKSSHVPEIWPIQGLIFNIFPPKSCWLHLLWGTFVLWKVGGHAIAGKETLKYMQAFRKSPRFSFTSPKVSPDVVL